MSIKKELPISMQEIRWNFKGELGEIESGERYVRDMRQLYRDDFDLEGYNGMATLEAAEGPLSVAPTDAISKLLQIYLKSQASSDLELMVRRTAARELAVADGPAGIRICPPISAAPAPEHPATTGTRTTQAVHQGSATSPIHSGASRDALLRNRPKVVTNRPLTNARSPFSAVPAPQPRTAGHKWPTTKSHHRTKNWRRWSAS